MIRSLLALSIIALLAVVLALAIGSVTISPSELWAVIQDQGSVLHQTLVWDLRLPRTLAAFATGGLLAVAGAL
ncbi:MAG: iron ABC transporter permease, partial [Gammaproteobacteria bacterium]|nr:iron ABC transporter permease [Gammaproteobacteria bacterium]